MKIIIQSVTKDMFGLYTIAAQVNGKNYNYELSSQHAVFLIESHYRAGRFGSCLAVLNQFKENVPEELK